MTLSRRTEYRFDLRYPSSRRSLLTHRLTDSTRSRLQLEHGRTGDLKQVFGNVMSHWTGSALGCEEISGFVSAWTEIQLSPVRKQYHLVERVVQC